MADFNLLQVTIFNSSGASLVPEHIMFQDDIFTNLDLFTGIITFYESYEKSTALSKLQLRFSDHQLLDSAYLNISNDTPKITSLIFNLTNYIQSEPILEVFSYSVKNGAYLFSKSLKTKDIMEALFRKLEDSSIEDIPYFMINCENLSKEQVLMTPFDYSVEHNLTTNVKLFIHFMTISDVKGILYQKIIDKNIIKLFSLGINMKTYFDSRFPFQPIDATYYPQYHTNKKTLIVPTSEPSIRDVSRNYQNIMPQRIPKEQWTLTYRIRIFFAYVTMLAIFLATFLLCAIAIVPVTLIIKMSDSTIAEKFKNVVVLIFDTISGEEQFQYSGGAAKSYDIEYFVVNLKETLANNKKEFMIALQEASSKDISYLELEVIQTIIKHKWVTYTKNYYLFQCVLLIVLIVFFVGDLINIQQNQATGEEIDAVGMSQNVCLLIIAMLSIHEIRQIRAFGPSYFLSFWNYFDLSWIFVYIVYYFNLDSEPDLNTANHDTKIIVLKCSIVILTFLKLSFYLRIFDGLGFLVQMIQSVLKDLFNFLFFFGIFVAFCGAFMSIIMKDISTDYPETAGMASFIVAFRMSIGDFTTDGFAENQNQRLLTWGIWVVLMLFGNVIFMNFIIAVVSESYENCMSKMIAQTYKVKVDLIVERESIMFQRDLDNQEYFPNYIILRKPVNSESDNEQIWQGFVKEIKLSTEYQISRLCEDIRNQLKDSQKQTMKQVNSRIEELEILVQANSRNEKVEAMLENIQQHLQIQVEGSSLSRKSSEKAKSEKSD